MDITRYISELLHKYDCVILPGFGGLVTDYSPAKIHPISHTFSPPCKSILFNSNLSKDDGLLMNKISIAEQLPYEEVKELVRYFVNDCEETLKRGDTLKLDKIGSFNEDGQGKILFNPDNSINYLEDSFGLPTFVSPPVLRGTLHKKFEKKFIDRRYITENNSKRKKRILAYAAIIPVLILIGWFAFNFETLKNQAQRSSVLPYHERSEILSDQDSRKSESETDNVVNTSLKDESFSDREIEKDPAGTADASEIQKKLMADLPRYFIIGGAFQFKSNAEKLIFNLKIKGYDAQSAGQNPQGLYMVSYFSTVDKEEALLNLSMIRKEDNPAAWLLKK